MNSNVSERTVGIMIGILGTYVVARAFNLSYRMSFVRELKKEPLDIQAQYKLSRIKSLLEAYE